MAQPFRFFLDIYMTNYGFMLYLLYKIAYNYINKHCHSTKKSVRKAAVMVNEKLTRLGIVKALLLFLAFLFFLALVPSMIRKNAPDDSPSIQEFQGWYTLENGVPVSVELPQRFHLQAGESLILYRKNMSEEISGLVLSSQAAEYNLQVFLDDQSLYSYDDSLFPRNNQMKGKLSCIVKLPSILNEAVLEFRYTVDTEGNYTIPAVYIGSGESVFSHHLSDALPTLSLVFAMLLTSLASFAFGVYMYFLHIPERRFFNAAAFLLLAAIWCLTDCSLLHIYSHQSALISLISFYVFMLMVLPLAQFINNTGTMKKYRIMNWYILTLCFNIVLQSILAYFHIFSMIQMLFLTHILQFFGALLSIVLLAREYKTQKSRQIRSLLMGFTVLGASGILALLLYWGLEFTYYETIFEAGIFFFGLIMLHESILSMTETLRYRTEAVVYQRMAQEDPLTGLGNRRSFDAYVSLFQKNTIPYENAALIFLDINNLKYANDNLGHNVGDEMIIAAAHCIEQAFKSYGKCFRIGGDEFCVIIKNPTLTDAHLKGILAEQLHVYNQQNQHPLSISIGISYLRNKDGTYKRVGDWKYDADQKMYKDKSRRQKS